MRYTVTTIGIIILLLTTQIAIGQKKINGRVVDSDSMEPVPFPSISLDNGRIWSMGNAQGEFNINIPPNSVIIYISSVGYLSRAVNVSTLDPNYEVIIKLEQETQVLPEIVIIPGKLEEETLGYTSLPNKKRLGLLNFGQMDYSAFAVLYKLPSSPTLVIQAAVYVGENSKGTFTLRCRIMSKDSNGPGKDILKENVFVRSSMASGWVRFNLEEHEVWVDDREVYLVVEILQEKTTVETTEEERSEILAFNTIRGRSKAMVSTVPGHWLPASSTVISQLKISTNND